MAFTPPGKYDVAPPTTGAHVVGEVVINIAPTRIGPPGVGYQIERWRCDAAGTPGAWTPVFSPVSPVLPAEQFGAIEKTSTAGFGQRDGAQLLYLGGYWYLLGGWNASLPNGWSASDVTTNEVWRSPDLAAWTKILAHDPNPPVSGPGARWGRRHSFGSLVVDNYLYVVGGDTSAGGPPYPSDIWRSVAGVSCGVTWEQVAATSPWKYLSIVGYFQGAIHIMGGNDAPRQHVRSLDGGVTWETLPDLPFDRSSVTRAVTDPNRNRMYIIGGLDPVTGERKNDCWEYDGVSWVQVSASAAWNGREWIATAYYQSRLWVLTGSNVSNLGGARYSENGGATWIEMAAVPWPGSHADGVFATESGGIALVSGSGLDSRAYLLKKLAADPTVFTATLPWTMWFEGANFNPVTPIVFGKPSAGNSESHYLIVNLPHVPSQGEINGRPTIILDGVNDVLRYTGPGEALDLISRNAYTIFFTGKILSSPTNSTTTYQNPGIACESTAYFGVGVRSNGAIEAYHDGGSATHADETWVPGELAHFQIRFDGANLEIRKNKGAWTSVAKGPITPLILGPYAIGAKYNLLTDFLAVELCENGVANVAHAKEDLDRVYDEQKVKWGL